METNSRKTRSRNQILDAADICFREKGYGPTTVGEIAEVAGLTRKTVYNLFGSKEEIVESLVDRIGGTAEPLYRARIEAGEDAVALLHEIVRDSAGWCIANPEIASFALAPRKRPQISPPEGKPSFQRIVRDVLALGQRQGYIRTDEDVDLMSMILLGIYAQAMTTVLSGHSVLNREIERIIRIVLEGLGSRT